MARSRRRNCGAVCVCVHRRENAMGESSTLPVSAFPSWRGGAAPPESTMMTDSSVAWRVTIALTPFQSYTVDVSFVDITLVIFSKSVAGNSHPRCCCTFKQRLSRFRLSLAYVANVVKQHTLTLVRRRSALLPARMPPFSSLVCFVRVAATRDSGSRGAKQSERQQTKA